MKLAIRKALLKAKYIACTADIWSRDLRSYIAVNAHWIDRQNGASQKALLSCERFEGSHTADAIASKLKGKLFSVLFYYLLLLLSYIHNIGDFCIFIF